MEEKRGTAEKTIVKMEVDCMWCGFVCGIMQVSLSFGSSEVRPADKLSLTVSAHRDSYVGILAVDQSVLLLKGGNDITQDMVWWLCMIGWFMIVILWVITLSLWGVQSIVMSMSVFVCLIAYVSGWVTRKLHIRTSLIFVHVAYDPGMVLLWWHCSVLCTSSFMYDIMFSYHGATGQNQANSDTVSFWDHFR